MTDADLSQVCFCLSLVFSCRCILDVLQHCFILPLREWGDHMHSGGEGEGRGGEGRGGEGRRGEGRGGEGRGEAYAQLQAIALCLFTHFSYWSYWSKAGVTKCARVL